ncbi:MAG: D-alanyl-D-alanine carboxypeptidase [Sphingobacteriales bacterium]|nr:D-alanyl-D-alanine carboxypeptidase [Sphingobacteriales bacterium]
MKTFQSFGVLFLLFTFEFLLSSCGVSKQISRSAKENVINAAPLKTAHIGISIYDPEAGKYLYNYQGDKYFVPASNTKIPTCYVAMKYLGDSLVGLRWEKLNPDHITVSGTGDPTFLHPDFVKHPVYEFLKSCSAISYLDDTGLTRFAPRGSGWSWDDYLSDYSAERSEMPVYGNLARFYIAGDTLAVSPHFFYNNSIGWMNKTIRNGAGLWFELVRPYENNDFSALNSPGKYRAGKKFSAQAIPFKTTITAKPGKVFLNLLNDTLHQEIGTGGLLDGSIKLHHVIHSQPTDSLLKPMMHRSDNFFAEQSLLMVSNERLGYMNDDQIIDTILKTDFKDLPQKPRWADGSGLSRYNLFTPQDFVAILNKMKNEFGMERIKTIFPTGGEGTISSYYKADSGYIYAKTGTLSGVVALSGFLYTKKGKLLIFSTLVNNHQASAAEVRRAMERFIESVREN